MKLPGNRQSTLRGAFIFTYLEIYPPSGAIDRVMHAGWNRSAVDGRTRKQEGGQAEAVVGAKGNTKVENRSGDIPTCAAIAGEAEPSLLKSASLTCDWEMLLAL